MTNANTLTSEAVIEELVRINCANRTDREKMALRQALSSLANLVRAEQALQIQRDMTQASRAMYGH